MGEIFLYGQIQTSYPLKVQSYRGKVILQALMDPLALGSVDIGWPGTASLSADRSGAGECP